VESSLGLLYDSGRRVIPVATVVQPLTGVLLIFETGRNQKFFTHEWLWISILLYIGLYYVAVLVQTPTVEKLIKLAEGGDAGTPEFLENVKKTERFGPVLGIGLLTIIFLMVAKPGAPDGFF